MNMEDSIKIVETILSSMRQDPAQFKFQLNVQTIGAMGIGGAGGHGIVATANAPGSTGFSATATAPSQMTINIAKQNADKELQAQFQNIDAVLQEIINELKSNTLNEQKKNSLLGQLKSTWLPNVIVSVVSLAVSAL